jgi:YD repeat-containing protein
VADPQFGPAPTTPLTSPGGPEKLALSQPTGDFRGAPENISELGGVDDEPQLPREMNKIRPDGGAIERPNADGSRGKGRGRNGSRKDWVRGGGISKIPVPPAPETDGARLNAAAPTDYVYDGAGRLVTAHAPDTKTWNYGFNTLSAACPITNPNTNAGANGNRTTMGFHLVVSAQAMIAGGVIAKARIPRLRLSTYDPGSLAETE